MLIDDAGWQVPSFDIAHWSGRRQDACVIIPVINEGPRIERLLTRMNAHPLAIPELADIIIVDGGSSDGSVTIERMTAHGVRALLIKTGPGKLSAQLRCAYAFAIGEGYQHLVTIDGNDKDDPEGIPRMLEALRGGVDFVQASRFTPGGQGSTTPRDRSLAIRWLHAPLLSLSSGFRWTDTTQGFRGYARRLLVDERVAPFRDIFDGYELLAYLSHRAPSLGFRCVEVPTKRVYPSGEVPTKIAGWRGNVRLFEVLCRACLGMYNPAQ